MINQLGATTTDFDNGNPASLTTSFIQAAGINRILVVCFGSENSADHDTVTFDGNALTELVQAGPFGSLIQSIWYLINPPVLTGDIVLTPSDDGDLSLVATSWDNVDQVTPFRDSAGATGTSGLPLVNVNSELGDLVLDGGSLNAIGNAVPGPGQTELADFEVTGDFEQVASKKDGTALSTEMRWSAGNNSWSLVAGSLQEAAAGNPIRMMV